MSLHPHKKPIVARKRFGQHFLIDQAVINNIITALAPQVGERIIEIGPGLGALTKHLLSRTKRLEVIELDRDLIPELANQYQEIGELIIYQADALHFDFNQLKSENAQLRIIGNLPYNISTPLLFHLLKFTPLIQDMLFMLQKEVAERIAANCGEKAYGRLSVMVQYFCQSEILFPVSPRAFNPPPKVDSAVIRLTPYRVFPHQANDFLLFAEVVRLAFNQRRKTLRNSLHTLITPEQLSTLGIDPQLRAERLSVEEYVNISNHIDQ